MTADASHCCGSKACGYTRPAAARRFAEHPEGIRLVRRLLNRVRRFVNRDYLRATIFAYSELLQDLFFLFRETQAPAPGLPRSVATPSTGHREMLTGEFEAEEAQVLAAELEACEVFVDVGANIGYYSCIACQHKKPVIALEPMAYNLRFFYENLRINGWEDQVEILPVGAGGKSGICQIYGASSTGASLVKGWCGSAGHARCTIPINTLDHLLADRMRGRKLLVKMDIEGGEYAALQGARQLLRLTPAQPGVVHGDHAAPISSRRQKSPLPRNVPTVLRRGLPGFHRRSGPPTRLPRADRIVGHQLVDQAPPIQLPLCQARLSTAETKQGEGVRALLHLCPGGQGVGH